MYGDSRLKFYIRENISVIRGKPGAPEVLFFLIYLNLVHENFLFGFYFSIRSQVH